MGNLPASRPVGKTVSQRLLEFFRANPSTVYPSGELQRLPWHNKNGTQSTPSSVTRTLRALAEEGKINVQEINGHAHYSLNPASLPKKQIVELIEVDGVQVARVTYV